MITFDTIDAAPEKIRQLAPRNAKIAGWANLSNASPDQYRLYREIGSVMSITVLNETEIKGSTIDMDHPDSNYYVVFAV